MRGAHRAHADPGARWRISSRTPDGVSDFLPVKAEGRATVTQRGLRTADVRSSPIRIAFASTYPPRHCGIATFTRDLSQAMDNREIVALTPPDQIGSYPTEVHHRVRRDERQDYSLVARALDRCRIDGVSIQHEYGIWGGDDGEHVLDFVECPAHPDRDHASYRPAPSIAEPAPDPRRARPGDRRDGRHVAGGGVAAERCVWRRSHAGSM